MFKKIFICLIISILSITPVFAAESLDGDQTCSFSLEVGYEDIDVSVYKVADLVSDNGNISYSLSETISSYILETSSEEISFDGMTADEMLEVASTIYDIITGEELLLELTSFSGTTDSTGVVSFVISEYGLYLVDIDGYFPYIAQIPLYENGKWIYDIVAEPKTSAEAETIPEVVEETTSDTDDENTSVYDDVTEDDESTVADDNTEQTSSTENSETKPPTGDESSQLTSWLIVGVGALIALIVVIIYMNRRKPRT